MYRWLRSGLFVLPPEAAHDVALNALAAGRIVGLPRLLAGCRQSAPVEIMGLSFPNPVGLAAGLDKNGDFIDALGQLGFGFIEVGTVTPKPQPGNPKPRMFRLTEHQALINRLGFNNKGVDHLVERLKRRRFKGIVGANIGKQKDTPVERAADDYRLCLEKVYPHCDYVTVNISSPNTANLRALQDTGPLRELLADLTGLRDRLAETHQVCRPVLIKIAPDWDDRALEASLGVIGDSGIDGLIATNTTLAREPVAGHQYAGEAGGLSGAPVKAYSDHVLKLARRTLGPDFPIIGLGGITSGQDAVDKKQAGADLVQIYTGFIYQGPGLIRDCIQAWDEAG
ncbi:MAG: quinone-dependent dihydroorotate dehydrogenase [Wenzhouxiangella sp.]|nr:MAG: quinone-dependent dihydroorotate dehydrogenase [Wenzhouxiangella sp.]